MCGTNKRFFLHLPLALLFAFTAGALRAEEPGPWFLISETELRSIEEYLAKSEREKQSWLSQAGTLKIRAGNLEADSASLNRQLTQAREAQRRLEQSFNEYEAGQLALVSSKNGEIANLKEEAAGKTLEAEKHKATSDFRLIVIIALAGSWIVYTALKLYLFFCRKR